MRRAGRFLGWTVMAAWFAFSILVLALRYAVLPQIENYREDVAALLSSSLGLKVDIEAISAGWRGLEPDLVLKGLKVHDRQGRPALAFDAVDASLSWTSLAVGKLVLARLEIDAPSLSMRREADGRVYIAGIPLNTEASGNDFSDWLLAQRRIVIRQARVSWEDATRAAPRLELQGVNLTLENFGSHHRFGLTAEPPAKLASRLDVRGDFRGADLDRLQEWHGQAYAAMDYADLAVWRNWVDYPLELPRGAGALHLWLTVERGRLAAATADLALRDVNLRLRPDLSALDLARLDGRLQFTLPGSGFSASAKGLSLETRDGIRLSPTDFSLKFTPAGGRRKSAHGEATANVLDLAALQGLAACLPLDGQTRQRIKDYAPQGRLLELKLAWQGDSDGLAGYTLKSRFERLGVQAVDGIPGFEGLSGSLEGSDQAGGMSIESQDAALLMPTVFADPRLALRHMTARLGWKMAGDELQLDLKSLNFDNQDAVGVASGTYRRKPGQVGVIDLSAQLSRGEGNAVWKYMPLVVNHAVRDWLQAGIRGGSSREARLLLKGDLKDFPFVNGKPGIFQVTGKFEGATLHYAPDWPDLVNINGDLLFQGVSMLIRADKGSLYGVTLSGVSAEIPNMDTPEPVLKVTGRAVGPTKDFLRFVEESPVSTRIDHFTAGMTAEGGGNLALAITLPLARLKDSSVQGEFQFVNDKLFPDPAMPPLTDVNGRLHLSDKGVEVKNATGRLLGGPINLSAQTRPDGTVAINAQGNLSVAGLRRELDSPLLDHLSGTAAWRGRLAVRKRNVDLVVDTSLQGVASSLPEPFNKSASDALPLHLERVQGDGGSDTLQVSLGKVLTARLLRRQDGGRSVVERGAVALQGVGGESPALPGMPDKGVVVAASLKSVNVDFWRRMFAPAGGEKADAGGGLPVSALALRSSELTAFGRSFSDVSLKALLEDNIWRIQLAGKDLAGSLSWSGRGRGRLQARLQQFSLGEVKPAALAVAEEPLRELPALDVTVDSFNLRGMALGRLELDAVNRGNTWQVRRVSITNGDGNLSGSGQWRLSAASPETHLNFKLETKNIGKLLERMGYPGVVRNGSALLAGNLSWHGVPTSLDYPSLQGALNVEASRGQFAKLEPGVGRLLGILSLQSLPRRLSLDFRDVFSEGFAFDSITGDVQLDKGVFTSKNLLIQGPAAHVLMSGEASLAKETQNLLVRVQPSLSDSVAVGTMIVNPVAGVATFLAQKLLKDPLGHLFEFDYAITGSWKDPKVEKLAGPARQAAGGQ